LVLGKYQESRTEIGKSMELDSMAVFNDGNLAALFYVQGRYDSVATVSHGATRIHVGFGMQIPLFRLAALRKLGDGARANALEDSIANVLREPRRDLDGSGRAMLYAATNKPDSAFYWLNHMVDVKSGFLFSGGIPCYSLFASLYNDPRWDALLKRINAVRCQR